MYIEGLTPEDGTQIAAMGLSIYESMVIGCLRKADRLMARRAEQPAWDQWEREIRYALNGALRYRERLPLIFTVTLTAALLPGLYPDAHSLRLHRTFETVQRDATRRSTIKRERETRVLRLREIVERMPLWVTPDRRLIPGRALDQAEREQLQREGCYEVWGAVFNHRLYDHRAVLMRLRGVLAIIDYTEGVTTYIAPIERTTS